LNELIQIRRLKYIIRVLGIAFILTIALYSYRLFTKVSIPLNSEIDNIIVDKSDRTMHVFSEENLLKTYSIAIGKNTQGKKEYKGDQKTPEGHYTIFNKNPYSRYHKNLGISYPNADDKAHAKKLGKSAGGDIKIHGTGTELGPFDIFHTWFYTDGCIRVTNNEMDELYEAVKIGAKIEVKP
jgi:murein L,D-transpeptidase YafK